MLTRDEQLGPEAAGALRGALEAAQRPSFKAWLDEQSITDAIESWEALQAYLRSRDVDGR